MAERIDTFEIGGWDEDGFHLTISTDDGQHELRVTDTTVAAQLLGQVDSELGALRDWVEEGEREHAAYMVASPGERARVLGVALGLELEDPDAFEERAEALRDGGDLARKRARGE